MTNQCDSFPVTRTRTVPDVSRSGNSDELHSPSTTEEYQVVEEDATATTAEGEHPHSPMDIIRDALKESRSWLDSNPGTPSCSGSEPPSLSALLQEHTKTPELYGNFGVGCEWRDPPNQGWVKVRMILDSGASASIAPLSMATGVRIEESYMSSRGQSYTSADGGGIENKGQQNLHVTTKEGRELLLTKCQVGPVTRPLMSVSQVADAGHFVMLDHTGGWIYNWCDESWTRVNRSKDIYEIELWLKERDADGRRPEPRNPTDDQVNAATQTFKEVLLKQPGFARQE